MNPAVLSSQSSLLITFLASFLIWILFAGLIILWMVDGRIKKEQALRALFVSFIAWSISQVIKSFLPTLRPFQVNGYPPLTLTIPFDGAFPSGHSATAFGLSISLWLHNSRLGIPFIVGASLVGLGRVLGNVHYLVDIFGGVFLGFATALILSRIRVRKTAA